MSNNKQEEEFIHKTEEVFGKPGEARKNAGQLLRQMRKEYNLTLPEKTLRYYGIDEKKNIRGKWWYRLLNVLTYWVTAVWIAVSVFVVTITGEYEIFEWVIIYFIFFELIRRAIIYIVTGKK